MSTQTSTSAFVPCPSDASGGTDFNLNQQAKPISRARIWQQDMSATTQQVSIEFTTWINAALQQVAEAKEISQRQIERAHRGKKFAIGCVSGLVLAVPLAWF